MRQLYYYRGFYYFRTRIPKDLQGIFNCRIIKKALKTCDYKTAVSSVKILSAEFDRIVNLIRSRILTDKQIKELAREYLDITLNRIEWLKVRAKLYSSKQNRDIQSDTINYELNLFKEHLAIADTSIIETFVDGFLKEKNVPVNKNTYEYKKICMEILKAQIEVYKIELERMHGNYNSWYDDSRSTLKQEPETNRQSNESRLLSEAVSGYLELQIANNSWKPKDLKEHRDFYSQFIEIMGDKDINTYTEKDSVRAFKILKNFPSNWKKKKDLRNKSLPEIIKLIER